MHQDRNSPSVGGISDIAPVADAEAVARSARRRALLKGLGAGGASLAAISPVQTFAAGALPNQICSLSGAMSAIHSQPRPDAPVCEGYSPSHYFEQDSNGVYIARNWPSVLNLNAKSAKVSDIFPRSTAPNGTKVLDQLVAGGPLSYWLAAYFNAAQSYKVQPLNFPYTASEVQSQFNTAYDQGLELYSKYLTGTP